MKRYKAILGSLFNRPLCILPEKAHEIAAFIDAAADGESIPLEQCQPQAHAFSPAGEQLAIEAIPTGGNNAFVAVLPLFGTMFQHGGMQMRASGGTSTETFGRQFSQLVNNPAVRTIVIEAHSPGGQLWGTQELSDLIYSARGSGTRVVTAVNSMAASAALWAGTAAERVYVTPGGDMGSVGVLVMHEDWSEAEAKAGVKTTLIATPEAKIAGHPYAPLPEEEAVRLKAEVEKTYRHFVGALARNRGVTKETVQADFGGGRMLDAKDAVKAGMADDVRTFREVLDKELSRLRPRGGSQAANQRALALANADLLDLQSS